MDLFTPGSVYVRQKDIHDVYGGQRYGGISTPRAYPLIFLFTGEEGTSYGYEDRFQADGSFWFYGEGQVGDMVMRGGNRAIRDHLKDGKVLHLFEKLESTHYRYIAEARCLDYHTDRSRDQRGNLRDAFVFELDLTFPDLPSGTALARESASPRYGSLSLWELRSLATQQPDRTATVQERRQLLRRRSKAVREYVLRRADGVCEACASNAPFVTTSGRPYLEPHHIRRVADGGPDHPRWVAALCPNCHREIHHGREGDVLNHDLADRLGRIEAD